MDTNNINDITLWKSFLQIIITSLVTVVATIFGIYKGAKWVLDEKIIPFLDDRTSKLFATLMKDEKEILEKDNEKLREQINTLEHDYKIFNEERVRELKEFIKEYK